MKYLLLILSTSILLSAEMEVDGNLKVTGTIQNDSLAQVIAQLEARIAQLECLNTGIIPAGYCDCFGNVLDVCDICGGTQTSIESCSTVQDIDDHIYQTVEINGQIWMAENLKTIRYQNGEYISLSNDNYSWINNQEAGYCNVNGSNDYIENYGRLYNGFAVNDERGLCMEGWHVPSDLEWKELEIFLGMCTGGMEEYVSEDGCVDNTGYRGDDQGLMLLTGNFNANLAGYRNKDSGAWVGFSTEGYYWSSTNNEVNSGIYIYQRFISTSWDYIYRNDWNIGHGMSVRCIKD